MITLLPQLLSQIKDAHLSEKNLLEFERLLSTISASPFITPLSAKQAATTNNLPTQNAQNIVNNIDQVIFEIDGNGNWTYLNPAWKRLTGNEVEDCLGKPFTEFLDNMDAEDKAEFLDLFNTDFDSHSKVVQIKNSAVGIRWIEINLKNVPSKDNSGRSFIGIISDVTTQKKTEFTLLKANEKEMLANRAKDEFLSTISHEIRTPLNAVIGTTHLLLLENPSAAQIENLNILKHASEHLLSLVNDILDFGKIESGNIKLEHIVFNFNNRLNSLLTTYGKQAEEKNIQFTINRQAEIPEFLMGDPTRLSQILTNLISNAIKFTDEGEVVLNVSMESQSEDHVVLKFEVIDTGIGISENQQEKIFDVFSQASSNTTRKYGGTGLGLSISKKLLQLMDSDIEVRSELGIGSAFSFNLKFWHSEEENIRKNYIFEGSSDEIKLNGLKILVAEDHKVNILMIQKFLARWDTVVDVAENGKEAVDKCSIYDYDVILMDLQMPIMNGFEASYEIRKFNKEIPIIALSASSATMVKDDLRESGIDGHIGKPFNPNTLFKVLKQVRYKGRKNTAYDLGIK